MLLHFGPAVQLDLIYSVRGYFYQFSDYKRVLSPYTGSTEVKARAVLCPLTSKGQPISMCYRSLNIGTGWC